MSIIVQKYGGTSVNTPKKRNQVLEKIIGAKKQGNDVVVVVSAMGRKGEPYATDTFLEMLEQVGPGPRRETKDLLISCGEIITACIVAHALEQKGYKACPMTGFQAGFITDCNFNNAEIREINPKKIRQALEKGVIVVLAGFQGMTENGKITTLGRGGSDTTAIALGGELKADLVEIYTDVPGIAFTDPRIIPEAPYLKSIDFYSMHFLAKAGAKVIYHRAVKTAINYHQPFMVRSTFDDSSGTLVGSDGESIGGIYGASLLKNIFILKIKEHNTPETLKRLAVDEMYYQKDEDGSYLAVQAPLQPEKWPGDIRYSLSAECDLLTLVWNPAEDLSKTKVEQVLNSKGIVAQVFFNLPCGGAWAVSPNQSYHALRLLFNHFARKLIVC